jgi:hypothetical protein
MHVLSVLTTRNYTGKATFFTRTRIITGGIFHF